MAAKIILRAPAPNMSFGGAPSGASYVSDQNALIVITNGSAADQAALVAAGCTTLYPLQTLSLPVFTAATLPAAAPAGQASFVSDCATTLASGLGSIVAGGAANFTPVYSDGVNWRVG
jgi:hypothetical protein